MFGEYVSVYDIQDAVDDRATVQIYYESRLAKLDINQAEIEKLNQVEEVVEDEEDVAQRRATKSKWAELAKLVGAKPRLGAGGAGPGAALRGARGGGRRQGDGRGDEPGHLRRPVRRDRRRCGRSGRDEAPRQEGRRRLQPGTGRSGSS